MGNPIETLEPGLDALGLSSDFVSIFGFRPRAICILQRMETPDADPPKSKMTFDVYSIPDFLSYQLGVF